MDFSATSSNPSSSKLIHEWNEAFAAFIGAFATPVAKRKDDDEYSVDARERMRSFDDSMWNFANPVALNTYELEDLVRQTGLGNGMFWPSNTREFAAAIVRAYCAKNNLPFPTNG